MSFPLNTEKEHSLQIDDPVLSRTQKIQVMKPLLGVSQIDEDGALKISNEGTRDIDMGGWKIGTEEETYVFP
jgi:hypothetical protein